MTKIRMYCDVNHPPNKYVNRAALLKRRWNVAATG
jgi:hypothetical protein